MGQPSERLRLKNKKKKWPLRSEMTPGERNVEHPALGDLVENLFASTAYRARFDNKISVKAMDK
jgi:xanthine dehydrogenase molybdopterin-binding subunit B